MLHDEIRVDHYGEPQGRPRDHGGPPDIPARSDEHGALPFHVRTHGSGSPVVLWKLHGTPTTTRTFDALVERLSAHHRVIVLALPGYDGTSWIASSEKCSSAAGPSRGGTVALVGFSGGVYHAFALASRGRLTVVRLSP